MPPFIFVLIFFVCAIIMIVFMLEADLSQYELQGGLTGLHGS